MITHDLLDTYESVKGEYEKLAWGKRVNEALWESVDGLLLDLHLIRHGYATDGYSKHIEKELKRLCADESVVERVRAMEL
ncbi:MAG TPA: hypothetical protein PK760_10095 [Flavobacteriales bacterium]|nr:hypothetical protein [Flavobacteriales bacterium]